MCSFDPIDRLLTRTPVRSNTGLPRDISVCACFTFLTPPALNAPSPTSSTSPRASSTDPFTRSTRMHAAARVWRWSFVPGLRRSRSGRRRPEFLSSELRAQCLASCLCQRVARRCAQEELKRSLARNVRKSSWLYIAPEGKEDQSTQLNIAKVPQLQLLLQPVPQLLQCFSASSASQCSPV